MSDEQEQRRGPESREPRPDETREFSPVSDADDQSPAAGNHPDDGPRPGDAWVGDGTEQLPGGPSGHPLSPFYRSGFDDWVAARPAPFLPGPAAHKLTLRP